MELRTWRTHNKLTLQVLADALGTTKGYVSEIERGIRHPSPDLAKRIEAFTNGEVTAAELLGLDPATPKRHVADSSANYAPNAVTVAIPEALFEKANEYGLDIPALVAEGGIPCLRAVFKEEYIRRNQAGIESTRRYIGGRNQLTFLIETMT